MKTLRTILRTFVLGAIAGLLIAPRSGRETREMLRDRFNSLIDSAPGMNLDEGTQTNNISRRVTIARAVLSSSASAIAEALLSVGSSNGV